MYEADEGEEALLKKARLKEARDRPFVAMMNFVIPLKQGKSAAMLWANL